MASATLTRPGPGDEGGSLQKLRAVPASAWAKLAFAAMCLLALVGYFAFPTYPTYDSFYALLWGRDLLHLHMPDFSVYRGPTEHPLAIAFGALCSIVGQSGARLVVLGSIVSFVALVAGLYRLGRLCFGPIVGAFAGLLVLSRFFIENLAAQGYLDISYVALVVWATALEIERPRRGPLVFLLLAAAGLLRPDAWLLSGVYWLWCAYPADTPTRLRYLALAAIAPLLWIGVDAVVTGDPLYSLHSTSGLASELERTQGFSSVLSSTWNYAVRIDKLPVVLGSIAGALIAIWLTPRRVLVPLVVLGTLLFVFVAEGAVGASVVDRYMIGSSVVMLVFCAVAVGGWSMLRARDGAEASMDGGGRAAHPLRRRFRREHAQSLEPAYDARRPRELPRGACKRPPQPGCGGQAEKLSAAVFAEQQADPRCTLDTRQHWSARHRRSL